MQCLNSGKATINHNSNGLPRLKYIVTQAEKRGLKLVINFVNGVSKTGDTSAGGGMPIYYEAFLPGQKKEGNPAAWYTSTVVQNAYKNYIQAVISTIGNSPAIFAWELANEPRCHLCATTVITNWATDVAHFIKKTDNHNHMVTLGDEGFINAKGGEGFINAKKDDYPYTTIEGIDFEANLKIPVGISLLQIYSTLTNSRILTTELFICIQTNVSALFLGP